MYRLSNQKKDFTAIFFIYSIIAIHLPITFPRRRNAWMHIVTSYFTGFIWWKNIILYKNNPANEVFLYRFSLFLAQSYALRHASVGVEHLIALLTPQSFQVPLTPRMCPVWDFVVGIFARKALLNSGRVLSTLSC